MKTIPTLAILILSCGAAFGEHAVVVPTALKKDPAPPSSTIAQDFVWIADTYKMDRLLSGIDPMTVAHDSRQLPDTRVVWRDYARQAWDCASRGDDAGVVDRIDQMLKLAAVYREVGGLQNVGQAEEIRSLAGQMVQQLGYGGQINSPYLESNVEECLSTIERQASSEKREVRPIFWQHLIETASRSYAHLTGQPVHALASVYDNSDSR